MYTRFHIILLHISDRYEDDAFVEDEEMNLAGIDEDGDGYDAWDEKITGHSDDDPEDKPTQVEVDAAHAEIDEENGGRFNEPDNSAPAGMPRMGMPGNRS